MSDAVQELEVELHGFYVGAVAVSEGDSPPREKPDDVHPRPIVRRYTGEVVGHLDLSRRDASILGRQLSQGAQCPRKMAELARLLAAEREKGSE